MVDAWADYQTKATEVAVKAIQFDVAAPTTCSAVEVDGYRHESDDSDYKIRVGDLTSYSDQDYVWLEDTDWIIEDATNAAWRFVLPNLIFTDLFEEIVIG